MEAFRAALAAGMDGLELDVQPTADGVARVLHDDTLERTALGSGMLRRLRSAELPLLKPKHRRSHRCGGCQELNQHSFPP